MKISRIALIYDDELRPETTGLYCRRALNRLVATTHFRPSQIDQIEMKSFDLVLNIDDGLRYLLPPHLRPCAWWAIDTHMDPEWAVAKGRQFDWVFTAQRDGAGLLRQAGLRAEWLPLACDPEIHRPHQTERVFDWCFVGRVAAGPRQELLEQLQRRFPNAFIGQRYFEEYALTCSQSRVGFNRSVKNDVNMRVFETLGCGTLLISNDLSENGQDRLLHPNTHFVAYRGVEELFDKFQYYLKNEAVRERIARAGHAKVLAEHTYFHRVRSVLQFIEQSDRPHISRTPVSPVSPPAPSVNWLDDVDFVIKTFLRPQALFRLLKSIREFYPGARVTIADDGNLRHCTDSASIACCQLIDESVDFHLLTLPYDSGVTIGRNRLIETTVRAFVLLLDDDFCFTAHTRIEQLLHRLKADPTIGVAAGACIDVVAGQRVPRRSGGTLELRGDTLTYHSGAWRDATAGLRDYVPHFALIRRQVFQQVQWACPLGGDHYDFLLQLMHSSWKVVQDESVVVDHFPSTEALAGYSERRSDYLTGQQQFLRKWQLRRMIQDGQVILERSGDEGQSDSTDRDAAPIKDSYYFEFGRPEVLDLIPATAARILDVGCGGGRLGELIKARQQAHVTGIELQAIAAERARKRLDRVIIASAESPSIEFDEGEFDCVICADVLEHLREPDRVLTRIVRWLAPGGTFVASIPNVRNHSVVASLLAGNWTYEAAGLLDNNHVRFFTRREIEKLLYRHKLELGELRAKPGSGYDEWVQAGHRDSVRIGTLMITGLSPDEAEEFFIYQYLVVANKPGSPRSRRARDPELHDQLHRLEIRFPWPQIKPNVPIPTQYTGWFGEGPQGILAKVLDDSIELVLELGAWLGQSTRFIADRARNARVLTVDHWKGSSEHRGDAVQAAMLPTLYETFLAVNWDYRHRIIPLRMPTLDGLRLVHEAGLRPQVIFIDADHSYAAVKADIELALTLFPEADLTGDDFDHPDVGRAVQELADTCGRELSLAGTSWRGWRLRPPETLSSVLPLDQQITSIIIVTFNQLAYTLECVNSIRVRTDEPIELIFVDNASSDGTREYLKSLEGVRVILNDQNRGFPTAVNQGIKVARGDHLLLLNNDTVVTTGWLRRLRETLNSDPRIGLVGPVSNCVSGDQQIPAAYGDMAAVDGFGWNWSQKHAGEVVDCDRLIGFCLMIRRELVTAIGVLDERFGIGCYEDDDYCLRARNAGYRTVIARDSFVHHYGNRSFAGANFDLQQILDENREKFTAKWAAFDKADAVDGNLPKTGDRGDPSLREHLPGLTPPELQIPPALSGAKLRPARPEFLVQSADDGSLRLTINDLPSSVCMIVRDNESTIRAAISSILPWVGEVVVVDTGSLDRTPDICRELGARVFYAPWTDDFAAARNESLRHARGEWILWFDSDDTFPAECGEPFQRLVDGPHDPNVLAYVMKVRCPEYSPDGDADYTAVDHVKLIRNRPDIYFEGRIHEQVLPSIRQAGGEIRFTELYVCHSGADYSEAGRQRKLERDLRILAIQLREQPGHPFVLFNLGMTYFDCQQYLQAIDFLSQSISNSQAGDTHLRKAYALLANSCFRADQFEESWNACQKGLNAFPADPELWFRSAIVLHHFGRLDEAVAAYERVLMPVRDVYFSSVVCGLTGYKTRFNLALVYEDQGRLDFAEEQWRLVVDEVPVFRLGWRGLAGVLFQQQKFDDVERLLDRIPQHTHLEPDVALITARLAELRAETDLARSLLEQALSRFPTEVELLRDYCRLLFEHGPDDGAEVAFRRLLKIVPDDPSALHNLGAVLIRMGRIEQGIQQFRDSIRLRPDSWSTWLQLAGALRSMGRLDECRAACHEALRRSPDNPHVQKALRSLGDA